MMSLVCRVTMRMRRRRKHQRQVSLCHSGRRPEPHHRLSPLGNNNLLSRSGGKTTSKEKGRLTTIHGRMRRSRSPNKQQSAHHHTAADWKDLPPPPASDPSLSDKDCDPLLL
jgi:hypothetical protein